MTLIGSARTGAAAAAATSYRTGAQSVRTEGEIDAGGDPLLVDLEYWFDAARGITLDVDGRVTDWADQTSHHRDVTTTSLGRPLWVASGINGLPTLACDSMQMDYTGPNVFEDGEPRTVLVICRPSSDVGGYHVGFRRNGRMFSCGLWKFFGDGQQYLYTNCVDGSFNIRRTPVVDYTGQALLLLYEFDGADLVVTANGVVLPVNQSEPGPEDGSATGFTLLNGCGAFTGWIGDESEQMCYRLPAAPAAAVAYLASKYGVPS